MHVNTKWRKGYRFGVVRPAVRPSGCPSVRPSHLGLYLKEYYRFEHGTSGVYRSHRGEVHCTRYNNPPLPDFIVIALCYFSYLNFVWNISH